MKPHYTIRMIGIMLCIAFSGLYSCKKSAPSNNGTFDNDPIATRTVKYLTQSPWKETALAYENAGGSWVSVPLQNAVLAQTFTFTATDIYDGTYAITSPGTTPVTGNWSITEDVGMIFGGDSYDFSTLNDTAMVLVLTAQIPYTDPATNVTTTYYGMRVTFGH